MTIEKTKASDTVSGGLICNPQSPEAAQATGVFNIICRDKDGNLKWEAESKNLVVNVGLQYMAGTALDGTTTRVTSWFLGLYGPGASNAPAAGNTMDNHSSWTEDTTYSNGTRVAATFVTATTANPSVVTNSASPAVFNINGATTIGGAFLTSGSVKGGTTGTLFSAADFGSPGDRSVVNSDTLSVTYTFSLAA